MFWDFAKTFRVRKPFRTFEKRAQRFTGAALIKLAKVDEVLGPTIFSLKKKSLLYCSHITLFWFQAVYNLAYMVEYNYSLNGIQWNNVDKNDFLQGNLTFAASLYKK